MSGGAPPTTIVHQTPSFIYNQLHFNPSNSYQLSFLSRARLQRLENDLARHTILAYAEHKQARLSHIIRFHFALSTSLVSLFHHSGSFDVTRFNQGDMNALITQRFVARHGETTQTGL